MSSAEPIAPTELLQPVLDGAIRSVNFFNGRLLSGEDLSAEQLANRDRHRQLGRALGAGIAYGLEVAETRGSTAQQPRVTIQPGLAINRLGDTLYLGSEVDLTLARPPKVVSSDQAKARFHECKPLQPGTLLSGEGVYLLVMSAAETSEGRAPVSGLGNIGMPCNTKFHVLGVQFRLISVPITGMSASDPRFHNFVAHACFGVDKLPSNPFSPTISSYGALDDLRPQLLTDCDVPLAIIHWATSGIRFLDMWAVRRRVSSPLLRERWEPGLGDRRMSEAEAIVLQFQSQIAKLQGETGVPLSLVAHERFLRLPPAGFLPVGGSNFNWQTFLGKLAPPSVTEIDTALLRAILRRTLPMEPISVDGTPTAAVDVFRVPGQSSFVFFARSFNGRIRVTFTPAPSHLVPVQLVAAGPSGNGSFVGTNATNHYAIRDLHPGTYEVRTTLVGFLTPAPQNATVVGGQVTEVGVTLQPIQAELPEDDREPAQCIETRFADPEFMTRAARVCMLTELVDLTPGSRDFSPKQVDKLTEQMQKWLRQWQVWLAREHQRPAISVGDPAILYSDATNSGLPSAVAAFGPNLLSAWIPLSITVDHLRPKLFIPVDRLQLRGVERETYDRLKRHGIYSAEQLVGTDSEVIARATGQTEGYARALIADASTTLKEIVDKRRYYEGVDDQVAAQLDQLGLTDDVALANADHAALADTLGSPGFATRLIEQARQVVPPEAWQLDELGLKPEQIAVLQRAGVSSQGELSAKAATEAGRGDIATAIGVDQLFVGNLRIAAISNLAASSVQLAPSRSLEALPGVNATIAAKLSNANIASVEALATSNAAELAAKTGVPEAVATNLITEARGAARTSLDVIKLAPVTSESATALKNLGVNNIADLVTRQPEDIDNAFGGDRRLASAVIEGARLALGRFT